MKIVHDFQRVHGFFKSLRIWKRKKDEYREIKKEKKKKAVHPTTEGVGQGLNKYIIGVEKMEK